MVMTKEDYNKRIMDAYLFEFMNHCYTFKKAAVLRSYIYDNDNVLIVSDGSSINDVYQINDELTRLNQDIIILSNDSRNNLVMRVYYGYDINPESFQYKIIKEDMLLYINGIDLIESIGTNSLPYRNFYEKYYDKLHVLLSDQLDSTGRNIAESTLINRVKTDFLANRK